MPKKLVPNPDFENALFKVDFIWHGRPPADWAVPEIRTNNPRYFADGARLEDMIPSHIEVED